jgi:hypothetical protein
VIETQCPGTWPKHSSTPLLFIWRERDWDRDRASTFPVLKARFCSRPALILSAACLLPYLNKAGSAPRNRGYPRGTLTPGCKRSTHLFLMGVPLAHKMFLHPWKVTDDRTSTHNRLLVRILLWL